MRKLIQEWIEAINARDPARLASLYSVDGQILSGWGELVDGQLSIIDHFDSLFRAFPNWTKEAYSIIPGPNGWGTVEWQAEGTFLGSFQQAEPTGRSFRVRGCGVFHVVDDRIRLHRRYLDRAIWYRQLGVTPFVTSG